MKKLLKKFEDIMVAVTFAEAGEYDIARNMSAEVVNDDEELTAEGGETETA